MAKRGKKSDEQADAALQRLRDEYARRRRGQRKPVKKATPAKKEILLNAGPWSPTAFCETCKSFRTLIIGTDPVRGIRWHRCECGRKFVTTMEDLDEFEDDTKIISHDGKSLTIAEWASQRKLTPEAILARIKIGWSIPDAIDTPKGKRRKRKVPRQRDASKLSYNGESLSIKEWSEKAGFSKDLIRGRLRMGWSIKDALTKPCNKQCKGATAKKLEHDGELLTTKEWAQKTGLSYGLINNRLRSGWSVARALTEPANTIRPRTTSKKKRVKADIHNAVRYAHDGRILTVSQWGAYLGIKAATIRKRIRQGLSMAEVFAPPRKCRPSKDGHACDFCGSTRTYINKTLINKGCREHRCHNCDKKFRVPIDESGGDPK